ncbi:MAG: Inner membrane transport protein YdhP [Candidatus Celerinatantimonas neptuna]|nr:MAG: Inner membrane transport protein YdhP [Candidatus Celerinatantimonas neptuna]
MPAGLYALALAAFGIGLTEFGIVGLLPNIATGFSINEQVAGYLVSGYAISVAIGALLLTSLLVKMEKRKALSLLTLLFIIGNGISAMASTYEMLLIGRIIAGLCHGAFFSLGAVVASNIVKQNQKAGAIALMFAGLTVSNIIGVPVGTFVGIELGWRATFWCLCVIGIITIFGIRILLPEINSSNNIELKNELAVFSRGQVWISILLSILSFGSVVGAFTYIAFTLTKVTGFAETTVPWLLVLFGIGTFIGNIYGGKYADKSINITLGSILFILAITLSLFAVYANIPILAAILLLLMGTVGLATGPGLQLRTMKYAGDAPTLASGANIAAFNVGNAVGAWIGGIAIEAGYGYTSPLWVGACLSVCALLLIIFTSFNKKTSVIFNH